MREDLILSMKPDIEDYSLENGYVVAREFLERAARGGNGRGLPCTALYAISDALAIGAQKALAEAGIDVPGEVSLAGFDGVEIGKYVTPSLTTIKQPVEKMALETIHILFDIIEGKSAHQHRVFAGELTVRASTRDIRHTAQNGISKKGGIV